MTTPSPLDTLPMPVFLEFLRRLHNGPPQHAAAVRVALAVLQGAIERGDVAQVHEALTMVRGEIDSVLQSLTELQETGRRWSGHPSPTHHQLAEAAKAAEEWEARLPRPIRG